MKLVIVLVAVVLAVPVLLFIGLVRLAELVDDVEQERGA